MTDGAPRPFAASGSFDYTHSAAVLIGTGRYTHLPAVPAATNSLGLMYGLLTGPLCGWPVERVHVFTDQRVPGDLPDRLVDIFSSAHDIALVYYVGHGQPDLEDRLCLGLVDSRLEPERRYTTSLPFDAVRHALRANRRTHMKILFLDCCYAGLALTDAGTLGAQDGQMISESIAGTGAYTVAACGPYSRAWFEDDAAKPKPYTHFTRALVDVVESGVSAPFLTLDALVERVMENLAAAGRPVPTTRINDRAGRFHFARYPSARTPTPVPTPDKSSRRDCQEVSESPARARADTAGISRTRVDMDPGAHGVSTRTHAPDGFPDVPAAVWRQEASERARELVRLAIRLIETDHRQSTRLLDAAEAAVREVADPYLRFLLLAEAADLTRRAAPSRSLRFAALARTESR